MIYIQQNKITKFFLASLVVLSLNSCDEDDEVFAESLTANQNITEIIDSSPETSSLKAALEEYELDATLSNTTTYTIFAPINEAFNEVDLSSLTEEERERVLLNHIWSTSTADVTSTLQTGYRTSMATDAEGNNLSFFIDKTGDLTFNGMASLVKGKSDLGATNGVVHMVNKLLLPPTIVDHALANPDYDSFSEALVQAELSVVLEGDGPFTVFAPNNVAFEMLIAQLDAAFGWSTLQDIPKETLEQVLLYHVVIGKNMTSDDVDGNSLESAQGESFAVAGATIDDATYTNAEINLLNIQSINGIIHGVEKVLLPDAIFQAVLGATLDIPARVEDRGFTTLRSAIELTGMSETWATENFTVFAPNDEAFDGLFATIDNFNSLSDFDTPEEIELLKKLLEYHLYAGTLVESQLMDGNTVSTVFGDMIGVSVTDAIRLMPSFSDAIPSQVINANIAASNGMIHEINRVLIPTELLSALGIEVSQGCNGTHPVENTDLVFFDWDEKGPWWGNVVAENEAALSLDGTSYGRINMQTGGPDWLDLFWRNGSTLNGAEIVGSNVNDYVLKFDINILEPIADGQINIRFNDADGVDAFYTWAPWKDTGEAFTTDGWQTIEIPLSALGVPDFSLVDSEFGMSFQDADVLLNFAIDNVRFDVPGYECGGPDEVDDTNLVFFDWDEKGPWWGNAVAENDASLTLDGSSYGRINMSTGGTGWVDMFWRNGSTLNGAEIVGSNIDDYVLKFDINIMEPISAGEFTIRFNDADGVDAFYAWAPWNDTGEAFSTDGWETIEIPLSVLGVPDFSLVDSEFGMAFQNADLLLNFAIDNVRFEEK